MSEYDIKAALDRLHDLGINTDDLHQDYYKIPLENTDLSKVERPAPTNSKVISKQKSSLLLVPVLGFKFKLPAETIKQ